MSTCYTIDYNIPILLIQPHCWLLTVFVLDLARPTTPPSATTFLLRNWVMMSSSSMWTLFQLFFFKHISCVFQVLILNFCVFVTRDLWGRPGGLSRASWISTWTMTYHEMQRDRDSEICLIHFTLIHRLALPDTKKSWTAMLLCMIAPGLDSSITAVSVRFFST